MKEEIKKIFFIKNKEKKEATLIIKENDDSCYLTLSFMNQVIGNVSDDDFFSCFSQLRQMLPDMTFLCKGAKVNVYPSRMSRQMSRGMIAYECIKGKPALSENIVNIFDYEDEKISTSPKVQEEYHKEWLMSMSQ